MRKRTCGYLLAVLVSLYLFFMFNEPVADGILILVLIYPVLSFLYLSSIQRKLDVSIGYVPYMGGKGEKIRAYIVLKNHSRTSHIRYCVKISINRQYSRSSLRQKKNGIAEPEKSEKLYFTFSSDYSGNLQFVLECAYLYDFLGIFYYKRKLNERHSVGILPSFDLMPLEITRQTREFLADAEDFSSEKSGDDPSEIYQIREYRPTDRLHAIHWKLSARMDELMVKEQALPLGCVVLIWIRFLRKDFNGESFSHLLEQAASLSATLMEEHCIHMAAWFEEKNLRVIKWKVNSEQAVYEWIWRLLFLEPCENSDLEQVYYKDAFLGDHFSSIVVIDGSGTLTVNGQKQELLRL